jgi:hypothetical protein
MPWRAAITLGRMPTRYRCNACGNLTRFDVVATRRTREYHHFSVGGELNVEDGELLEERIEEVTCRWCGATGGSIEQVDLDATPSPADGRS